MVHGFIVYLDFLPNSILNIINTWDNSKIPSSGSWKTGDVETQSGDTQSGETETKSVETQSGETQSVETQSGETQSVETQSGETQSGETQSRSGKTDSEDIEVTVNKKYYFFYHSYIKLGNDTKTESEILKRWFVLHFFVYLIFVSNQLVEILSSKSGRSKFIIAQSSTLLAYDLLSMLLPYFVANWLNQAHHEYYEKMLEVCLKLVIKVKGNHVLVIKPGFSSEESKEGKEKFDILNKNQSLNSSDTSVCYVYKSLHTNLKDQYMKYYKLVLANNITLKSEFDFVPSIFGISIPLDSPGYAMALLLSVLSIVVSLLQ